MLRYYFDVHDGVEVRDGEGVELSDVEEARAYAIQTATGFTAKPGMLGEDGGAVVVTVRSDATTKVMAVRLVFNVETK